MTVGGLTGWNVGEWPFHPIGLWVDWLASGGVIDRVADWLEGDGVTDRVADWLAGGGMTDRVADWLAGMRTSG